MVYMNLVGKWSLTTPLMGLSHTRSYYEIFSPKFMTFFKKKLPGKKASEKLVAILISS